MSEQKEEKANKQLIKENVKKKAIFFSIVVLISASIFMVFSFVPPFSYYNHFVIATSSMDPVIKVGDVVFINKNINLDSLQEDDIIAFFMDVNLNGKKEVVIHYIAKIETINDVRVFRTRREDAINEADWDDWQITDSDIVGKYASHIPAIGKAILFVQSSIGKVVIAINLIVIYFAIKFLKEPQKQK